MTSGKAGPESSIGVRIATARYRLAAQRGKNVTQAWLAAQCGVSGPTVSQWETGTIEPTVGSLAKIAKALDVSPGWLAFGEEPAADDPTNPATARRLTEAELDRADAAAAKKRGGDGPRRKAQ